MIVEEVQLVLTTFLPTEQATMLARAMEKQMLPNEVIGALKQCFKTDKDLCEARILHQVAEKKLKSAKEEFGSAERWLAEAKKRADSAYMELLRFCRKL